MKKIPFHLLFLTLVILVSCQKEEVLYNVTDKALVSFPSTLVTYDMVAADNNKFVVELWRGNTQGAVSIPVTISNEIDGVFTAQKNQFDFADGESKAYLTFTYPDLNTFGGEAYNFTVKVNDEAQVSPGGNGVLKVTAKRKLTFKSIGTGTFTSEFFEEGWEQEVLKAVEGDYYRLPDLYYKGYNLEFGIVNGKPVFGAQPMGYNHSTYGMINWVQTTPEESVMEGKTVRLFVDFRVPAGSFGEYFEVIVLP